MAETFAGGPKTGAKCKLYRNNGTVDSPDWDEIKAVGDVGLDDLVRNTAELKRRGNDWTKKLPSLMSAFAFNFELIHGLEATMFDLLRADFFSGAPKEYALMDGNMNLEGSQGLRAPMLVEEFPFNQALEDVAGHSMKLSLTFMMDENGDEIDPAWIESEGSV